MRLVVPGSEVTQRSDVGIQLRELDRRTASVQTSLGGFGLTGTHYWNGSGTVAPNTQLNPSSWTEQRNDGLVNHNGSGAFTLKRTGRWSVAFLVYSDSTTAGTLRSVISNTSFFGPLQNLRDTRYCASGFAGAGYADQCLEWTASVMDAARLVDPFTMGIRWFTPSGGVSRTVSYAVCFTYLGEVLTQTNTTGEVGE